VLIIPSLQEEAVKLQSQMALTLSMCPPEAVFAESITQQEATFSRLNLARLREKSWVKKESGIRDSLFRYGCSVLLLCFLV
jgi:hypothetical protein